MSLIFGDKQTGWDADSLALIFTRYSRPLGACCINPRCGRARKITGNGRREGSLRLCRRCYDRWRAAGKPDTGVPDPMTRAEICALGRAAKAARGAAPDTSAAYARRLERRAARMEDFCFLREHGVPVDEAAARVGVRWSTGREYEERRLAGEISSDMSEAA